MCEPLKGKIDGCGRFAYVYVKSAVKGLIKYHEERLEYYIDSLKLVDPPSSDSYDDEYNEKLLNGLLSAIQREYTDINAIEYWLEGAIEITLQIRWGERAERICKRYGFDKKQIEDSLQKRGKVIMKDQELPDWKFRFYIKRNWKTKQKTICCWRIL